MKNIWLVIPCYNEEKVLPETSKRLKIIMERMIEANKISPESKIVFVNDGSKDKTWNIIKELHNENKIFSGINLSRNRGHQNALLAGLLTSKDYADAVISLDADLQDDVEVIEKFIDQFYNGYDVVYGVRSSRKKDTFFKRFTAESFYKVMKFLGVDIVFNHADYRLMSKRALEGLEKYGEVNLFLRGIVPLIGFPSTIVEYERNERFAGESKYPLKKMLAFAFNGITSFSVKPIRMILNIGFMLFFISVAMMIWSVIAKIVGGTVVGWTSLMISIWMIGGIQLISIGFIGEYIGKIYEETKKRPRYIIESFLK
ncbi:MAG: glycosyltransferase family 2 protein [Bacillota bacterium]|nr:glycosyltransferase family 2 protein [Bacillota bacterium]